MTKSKKAVVVTIVLITAAIALGIAAFNWPKAKKYGYGGVFLLQPTVNDRKSA